MLRATLQAVIFDMDGTLVDTEAVSQLSWEYALTRAGMEGDTREFRRSVIGRSVSDITAELVERLGTREQADQVYAWHNEDFALRSPTELKAKPGAREAVLAVRAAGYRVALATSSYAPVCYGRLARFDMDGLFDSFTCGDEIEHSKPDPEIFLRAASKLGVAPASCAVIEDSPNGVRSAHAAGMRVLLVPDLAPIPDEVRSLCDAVLSSISEVPAALAEL